MRVLMTGGCGFVGTAIAGTLLRRGYQLLNLDKLTYAAAPEALADWGGSGRYRIVEGDVCDMDLVLSVLEDFQPDSIVHCAAESHVDRSIESAAAFLQTNYIGTYTMHEAARHWWAGRRGGHRFHHISTDEVYGSLKPDAAAFTEATPYAPNSPYAASKAGADHLVRAWGETYGLPVVTTHCSNNFGPWQFPEKLIPLMITKGVEAQPLPVYGSGQNVRDWIHVDDHASAVSTVLEHGKTGETYNIGGASEQTNLDVVQMICAELDRRVPGDAPHASRIRYVEDRPGHDFRYAVDTGKIRRELGWRPRTSFREGLSNTVDWYLSKRGWWQAIRERRYGGQRLGREVA